MASTAFILIVTADESGGERLRNVLRERSGHSCHAVASLDEARTSIAKRAPDVVVADARLNGGPAARALSETLGNHAPDSALVLVGDNGASPDESRVEAVFVPEAMEEDELVDVINAAAGRAVRRRDERLMIRSIDELTVEAFEGIVGTAPQMLRIIERIKKAARNKLTVLILGETGTGKELIAEAIHRRSDRARKPYKTLNCAGLNENLLESELFGHVKGAFTGAIAERKGYFAAADGGTLFLDEIGDMPMTMQAKLLRALERREITPVGSTEVQRVDVRVVSATNVDLHEKVEDKKFREDLYYRLKQWVIEVPPLRERRQDIPLLAIHFLRRARETHGLDVPGFSSDAMAALAKYFWPGNVRELANVVEALAVEAENRRIERDDLPEQIRGRHDIVPVSAGGMVGLTMAEVERLMIDRTLQATGGNREQAAKMLDIGTRTLYRKIKEYGLQ